MIKFDYHIAVCLWIVSLFTIIIGWPSVFVITATTVNLWHQRRTTFNAGIEFERRVTEVLGSHLDNWEGRMKLMESNVSDIKESQVKIAGAFRGRQLP